MTLAYSGRVNEFLKQLLEQCASVPERLAAAMSYSVLAPGKRLRPHLVILACEAAGGAAGQAIPAAAAVELIHTYSLIHDDLPAMDDDDLRRGRPTCHRQFDDATAVLAGDALLTLAFQVIVDHYPARTAASCCRELAVGAGAAGMVGGQMLDLLWENREGGDIVALESIHSGKTSALFRACLRIGGRVAQEEEVHGADPKIITALDRFGSAFGLMFQITDDLLDVEGDAKTAGKHVGKDAKRGKLTFPGLLGVDESRQKAQKCCEEAEAAVELLSPAASALKDLARAVCNRDR